MEGEARKIRIGIIVLLILISLPVVFAATPTVIPSVSPSEALVNETLQGICNGTDAQHNLTYQFKWYVNDSLYSTDKTPYAFSFKANLTDGANWYVTGNDMYIVGSKIFYKTNLSDTGTAFTDLFDANAVHATEAYIYGESVNNVHVVNGTTLAPIANISAGDGSQSIFADDTDIFILTDGDDLYRYDVATRTRQASTTVAGAVSVTADSTYVYVLEGTEDDVDILLRSDLSVVKEIEIPANYVGTCAAGRCISVSDDYIFVAPGYNFPAPVKCFMVFNKTSYASVTNKTCSSNPYGISNAGDDYVCIAEHDSITNHRLKCWKHSDGSFNVQNAFSGSAWDTAYSVWIDDPYLYGGSAEPGKQDLILWTIKQQYNSSFNHNVGNISNSTTNGGEKWDFSCMAEDPVTKSAWSNTTAYTYPNTPTLTDRGYSSFFDEMALPNSTKIVLKIEQDSYYDTNYTLYHTFDQSCFNVTTTIAVPSVVSGSYNTSNVTFKGNGTDSCYGLHQGSVIAEDGVFGINTTFPVNITLSVNYVDVMVANDSDITVFPAGWACADSADANATCTKDFYVVNKGTGDCSGGTVINGFTFDYESYTLAPGASTMVTVSTSVGIGSYDGSLEFQCGASTYRDVSYDFEIIKQGGGGGGGAAQIEIKRVNLTDHCGDGICQDTENPNNCWDDCKVNYDTLFTCLFDDDLPCNWSQNWFPVALLTVLLGVGAVSIYKFETQKKRRRR